MRGCGQGDYGHFLLESSLSDLNSFHCQEMTQRSKPISETGDQTETNLDASTETGNVGARWKDLPIPAECKFQT